jgi:hypothetical protein
MPVPTGKRNARMRQTVGDMVRSLAVVLGVIGVIMLVTWRPNPDPVREVDPIPLFTLASGQATFPVVVPEIDGLRATSVRWEPTQYSQSLPVWHVGYVTAEDQYLQITQSAATNEEFLKNQLAGVTAEGEEVIAGQSWLVFSSDDSRALVNVTPEVTTIVSGSVTLPQLEAAANSLVSAPSLG